MTGIDPDKITELASAPKVTQGDEGRLEERPISELIAADQYLKSQNASTNPPGGMRIARVRYPSSQ